MKNRIIYVPLDERNCNYGFPWELGRAAGLDVLRPPLGLMSRIKQPCCTAAMWDWLHQNAKACSHAVLSLDMLAYGCLINSRRHQLTAEECIGRLNGLRELKQQNPGLQIHAFNLIMRTPNYDNSSEEPDYWADFGKSIWKYSWLSDKKQRLGLNSGEESELAELENSIPSAALQDYLHRRAVNLRVNLAALDMVKDGVIDRLVIPKDDNSEFSLSARDQDAVCRRILESGIRSRVFIYPGADEVGCTLMCRVLNSIRGVVPKVYVAYSSTYGPDIIAKYEDRPIHESVKWQALSSGAMMSEDPAGADIVLMVNTPGRHMIECADQWKRDNTYTNFRNLDEFVQKLKYFASIGKRCAVADIAYPNGADNELMEMLKEERMLGRIFAYGGWNTTANTLGVVMLQSAAALALGVGSIAENRDLLKFHVCKIVEDWAYQANVLNHIAGACSRELGFDSYNLGPFREQAEAAIVTELNKFLAAHLTGSLPVSGIRVRGVEFPWDRAYDITMDIELVS